ncbi:HypC/HybG/HupF family hydrogenase formation chaperone [Spectribacter hydrogenoxidans]|uniref:HypC/HybG/HupF family hydrogenase formation chaperone n=1 Tax=Spectribacter hydrogenoxidans TaxID=3075608 RepID=A0ABU3C419_9GAMM|nr:HypC/HybG/HupF family hydrogenase formation chaperone [Salinisphaera sp. W335]MDT0636285.1 HypC/HybG/HupF family hydrogenase formation chaperone [Salinisphaera sp. W335]
MCVGIPGQIVDVVDTATDTATVEIGGIRRAVNISCVVGEGRSHADCVGEWVLVHVGFAMSRIDENEAIKTLQLLQELGEMQEEMDAMQAAET